MDSHQATAIFVLVCCCCCGGVGRTVWANIVDGRYYGPHRHQIGGGYLYGTGSYHRGPQHYRNIGLISNGNSRLPQMPALASIATTAAVAMPRNNYINRGHRPYQNVIIPMSPYFWSAPRSGLHRGNDYYRGLGSRTAISKNQQHLFGGLIPKKTRKIVIDGPGGHVSQSFIRGPNTHYGYY
ncbi:uncharacterized protein LOC107882902 [Acyrthosiphon pisum]|uniref:Secreted protein n=1 Tax=Acyrthosiphon pisum TaxID=7029 RepID=A0A8R2H611_ACYPI|nr:uncharacterized protein LOC107882902 [Acyrthosiphon pisum]XP_016657509.1 uncharacterized protein LOC107882902 [Acyrthosiphon pisum]XP_016657510.1 uncharacterized protein LOC107882902 [Acyrthosiphon pisum]|eukprot:XP_016657508.1 PREDICTED: uncharacterized protein LOC107882902 [Acyrthosiphon pisum]